MHLSAKMFVAAALAAVAGYFTYGAVFAGTWSDTLNTYGQPYHLRVMRQGVAGPALTGVNIGQYNATPMRSDIVQLTPEQGGPSRTVKINLETDLETGNVLSVFWNGKDGIATPMDAVGGRSYWHGLAIAAGCIAGIIAGLGTLFVLACFFPGSPRGSRALRPASCS